MIKLVVTVQFGNHPKGSEITDPKLVAQYLATHPNSVVRVDVPTPSDGDPADDSDGDS